ncbi:hypothetical protein FZEAL_2834 [Fusarium zealandicum]|uniref:N-acetyltransferase domain-containing protein n=1 Tax=Fusarium zealandicum TaxID=1053134 RepID=A0A8H4UPX1_9HYPO|nr:hypothetical protein FZEAL_2834 [Fusarium zealandicum]
MSQPPGSESGRLPKQSRATASNVSRSLQQFRAHHGSSASNKAPAPHFLPKDALRAKLEAKSPHVPVTPTQPTPTGAMGNDPEADQDTSKSVSQCSESSSGTTNSPREQSFDGIADPSRPKRDIHSAPLDVITQALCHLDVTRHHDDASTEAYNGSEAGDPGFEDQSLRASEAMELEETSDPRAYGKVKSAAKPSSVPTKGQWQDKNTEYPVVRYICEGRDLYTDRCDIDTATGELLKPLKYIKLQTGPDSHMRDPSWHYWGTTSEMNLAKEMAIRENLRARVLEIARQGELAAVPEEEPWPNASCTLRPAVPEDFQGIVDIINLESQQQAGSQVLLPLPIGPAAIGPIHSACLANHQPFIVAVPSQNEFLDRSKWPKGAEEEYQAFLKFKKSQSLSKPGTVLGFAFVTDSRQGFLGGPCLGSRFTGQIRLVVHPSHRRKLIGSALLDRILLSVTIYHRSLVDYKWECPDPGLTYQDLSAMNRRQYAKVYIETFFADKNNANAQWMARLLEKFAFERVACFKEAAKRGSVRGTWLDLVVWELEARPVSEIGEG